MDYDTIHSELGDKFAQFFDSVIYNNISTDVNSAADTFISQPYFSDFFSQKSNLKFRISLFEIAFERFIIRDILKSNNQTDLVAIDRFLDLSIYFVDREIFDGVHPCSTLEFIFESLDIQQCLYIFNQIVKKPYFKTIVSIPSSAGKGQVLLRTLNNLIERIPKSIKFSEFRGQVMQFSARVFSISDRSGMNFKGEYDSGFVLSYETDLLDSFKLPTNPSTPEISSNPTTNNSVNNEPVKSDKNSASTNTPSSTDSNTQHNSKGTFDIDIDPVCKQPLNENISISDPTALINPESNPDSQNSNQISSDPQSTANKATENAPKKTRETFLSEDATKFYLSFWELQKYFASPWLAFEDNTFDSVSILTEGDKSPQLLHYNRSKLHSIALTKNEPLTPITYLTNPTLLTSQLSDPRFRTQILIQILIFCNYALSATKENIDIQMAAATINKNTILNFKVSPEQQSVLNEIYKKSLSLLSSKSKSNGSLARSIFHILKSEKNWVSWKNENCQPFVKPKNPDLYKDIELSRSTIFCNEKDAPPFKKLKISKLENSRVIDQLDDVKIDPESIAQSLK
ncbi:THO complex subunit 1 [Smittium culicis]|uniref:THO complex subunit 1 n=1 Tax=Smittium culicis TaxID=133412 RepID=A0A1R1Y0T9_9FUNG|nr:THO complex subunit 1 [Smittium culicis]